MEDFRASPTRGEYTRAQRILRREDLKRMARSAFAGLMALASSTFLASGENISTRRDAQPSHFGSSRFAFSYRKV